MKKLYTLLAALVITASTFAQAPEKMSYQAVVRDAGNAIVSNQAVGMQISILQDATAVYVETQTPTTNANGLVSIQIGMGSVVSGDFSAIDWSAGPYFIKTETDPTGATTYTITGTSELLSVPFALHATNGQDSGTSAGDMQYWNGSSWDVVAATPNEGATLQMIGGVPTWTGGTLAIGDIRNGGVVFYIAPSPTDLDGDGDLDYGLVCAMSDFSNGQQWGCNNSDLPNVPNGASAIGDGATNTNLILIDCPNAPAALAARSFGPEWFLPSIGEWNEIYDNKAMLETVPGFTPFNSGLRYWSSTELNYNAARTKDFANNGATTPNVKVFPNEGRAVRAF